MPRSAASVDAALQLIARELGANPNISANQIQKSLQSAGLGYSRTAILKDIRSITGVTKVPAVSVEKAKLGGIISGAMRTKDIAQVRKARSAARRSGDEQRAAALDKAILRKRVNDQQAQKVQRDARRAGKTSGEVESRFGDEGGGVPLRVIKKTALRAEPKSRSRSYGTLPAGEIIFDWGHTENGYVRVWVDGQLGWVNQDHLRSVEDGRTGGGSGAGGELSSDELLALLYDDDGGLDDDGYLEYSL